jgi:steroid delta-isomerase
VTNTPEQIHHVWIEWHEATKGRDRDRLAALYAPDATFESPTVIALNGTGDGVLRGADNIVDLLAKVWETTPDTLGEWYRTSDYYTNGSLLMWEYPSEAPAGRQAGLVESMDIENGLIARHRVYWGWVGVRSLLEGAGGAQPGVPQEG